MTRTFHENCIVYGFFNPKQIATGLLPYESEGNGRRKIINNMGGKPMENTKNESLALISATDQMCEHMTHFADVLNAYRKRLREGGHTKQEAFHLVMDFQQMFWTKQFYPNSQGIIDIEDF